VNKKNLIFSWLLYWKRTKNNITN